MRTIETKKEYEAITKRIEELLILVDNSTPTTDKDFIELDLLSDLVADYEEATDTTLEELEDIRLYDESKNDNEPAISKSKAMEMIELKRKKLGK